MGGFGKLHVMLAIPYCPIPLFAHFINQAKIPPISGAAPSQDRGT